MEHHIYVRALTEYAKVETTFHGGLHAIEHFARSNDTLRNFLLLNRRHPRTCARNKGFVANAPIEVATTADGETGITHTVRLFNKFFDMKWGNHCFRLRGFKG